MWSLEKYVQSVFLVHLNDKCLTCYFGAVDSHKKNDFRKRGEKLELKHIISIIGSN